MTTYPRFLFLWLTIVSGASPTVAYAEAQGAGPLLEAEKESYAALCTNKGVNTSAPSATTVRPTRSESFSCIEEILRALSKQTENVDLRALGHRQLWIAAEVLKAHQAATGGEHPFIAPMLEGVRDDEGHPLRKEAWLALTLVREPKLADEADIEALGDLFIDPDEDFERMDSDNVHPLFVERMTWYFARFIDVAANSHPLTDFSGIGSLAFSIGNLLEASPAVHRPFLARQLGRRILISSEPAPPEQKSPLPRFRVSLTGELCAGRRGCEEFKTASVQDGVGVGGDSLEWKDDTGGTASYAEVRLNHVANVDFPRARQFTATVMSYVRGGHRAGSFGGKSPEDQVSSVRYVLRASAVLPECKSISGCSPVIGLHFHAGVWPPEYQTDASLTVSRDGKPIHALKSTSSVSLDRTGGPLLIEMTMKRSKAHEGACCEQTAILHPAGITLVEPDTDPASALRSFTFPDPPPGTPPPAPATKPGSLSRALLSDLRPDEHGIRSRWIRNVGLVTMQRQQGAIDFAPIGEILVQPEGGVEAQFDTRASTIYAKLLYVRILEERAGSLLTARERQSLKEASAILSAHARRFYATQAATRRKELEQLRSLIQPEKVDSIMKLLISQKGLVSIEALRDPKILRELGPVLGADSSETLGSLLHAFEEAQASNNLLAAIVALQEVRSQIDLLAASLGEEIKVLEAEMLQLK